MNFSSEARNYSTIFCGRNQGSPSPDKKTAAIHERQHRQEKTNLLKPTYPPPRRGAALRCARASKPIRRADK